MMRKHFLSYLLLSLLLFANFIPAIADTCYHSLIEAGDGVPFVQQVSCTSEGHFYRYFLRYFCTKCFSILEQPANKPNYPDYMITHDYTISANHRLTANNLHTYDLKCNLPNCPFYITLTHSSSTLYFNHGHIAENVHKYTYICNDCTTILSIEKFCADYCESEIYKYPQQTETN